MTLAAYAHPVTDEAQQTVEELQIRTTAELGSIEQQWRQLQKQGSSCIYQDYDWVRIAYATLEKANTPLIVYGMDASGRYHFIIPLVIEAGFPKVVRWPGGSHANICSGIFSKTYLQSADLAAIQKICRSIRSAVSGISVLRLGNQPHELAGFPNPMKLLRHQTSANLMFDMDLRQGMDAILDAGNGKRKRKLFRRQVREAEKLGGHELYTPNSEEEILASLKTFYEQRSRRFKEMGVRDVFQPQEVREFVQALALEPARDGTRLLRMFELKVGGKTRAMYGCGILGNYCQAWVNSVAYDEFANLSPGEMVLYLMVEQLIEEDFDRLDLGVGMERYKVSWCQSENTLFDVFLPLNAASYPIVAGMKIKTSIKAYLRNNETYWSRIKNARKWLASKKAD